MENLTLNDVLKQSARHKQGIEFPLVNLLANLAWTFGDLTSRHTSYVSHGYHRYPAKFIPQLTRKVIEQYSEEGALICDPFMGSGTTVLEALLAKRKVIGTDINPVAVLITQAKLRPFPPKYLQEQTSALLRDMKNQIAEEVHQQLPLTLNSARVDYLLPENERLVYWYPIKEIRQELAIILAHINKLADIHLKRYFQCAFSHILKNTSIWLNKSTKPTRDLKKSVPAPLKSFTRHVRKMNNRNRKLYFLMDPLIHERLDEYARVANGDARRQQSAENMVDLVVTSPPYVTSYEYADLHQLTALWFSYTESVS